MVASENYTMLDRTRTQLCAIPLLHTQFPYLEAENAGNLSHRSTMSTRWVRHVDLDLDSVKMVQEHPKEEQATFASKVSDQNLASHSGKYNSYNLLSLGTKPLCISSAFIVVLVLGVIVFTVEKSRAEVLLADE